MEEARVVSLEEAFELDPSIGTLARMPCGCYAERRGRKSRWVI